MVYIMNTSEKKLTEQDLRPLITDPQKEVKKITKTDVEQMRKMANERAIQLQQMKMNQ